MCLVKRPFGHLWLIDTYCRGGDKGIPKRARSELHMKHCQEKYMDMCMELPDLKLDFKAFLPVSRTERRSSQAIPVR